MYKTFNYVIIIFAFILLFFSTVTFLIIQFDLFNYPFNFSPKGLNEYLNSFFQYSGLFTATITLIVAYFGIKRFEAADTANYDKVKLDRYSDWKIVTDIRIDEIEENSKRFRREFYKIRYNLFMDLYLSNISIKDKNQLKKIFDLHFKERIAFFDEMTKKNIGMGSIYRNEEYTYFFDDLYYIFVGSLNETYDSIYYDFKQLYVANLNPNRIIDEDLFNAAQITYHR